MNMPILFAQELHDIAPAVDYSLVPTWVVFVGALFGLLLLGLIGWLFVRWRKRALPIESPEERALRHLERMRGEVESLPPYLFSIRVSNVLRRYVTEQFDLPVTRQTSVEFLTTLAKSSPFSDEEKLLLEDFLSRCDLIKFARYDATVADSRSLLDEASQFVKGGQLATASV